MNELETWHLESDSQSELLELQAKVARLALNMFLNFALT